MYEDRFLLIFGGVSKSKSLNDLFSLDFESVCAQISMFCVLGLFLIQQNICNTVGISQAWVHLQMEWSRLKTKGVSPGPRAGHAGVLIGDKWCITGGDIRGNIRSICGVG